MVRLDDALQAVGEALEAALQAAVPRPDAPYVVLGNPAEANAKYGETSRGRVMLTLVGLRAGAERGVAPPEPAGSGPQPTGALEADLLITTDYPGQYSRGLRMLATALDWVHDNPVVIGGNAPEADRIMVGLIDPTFEEAAALVAMAGVKGCPFALLRLRGLSTGQQAKG